MLRRVPTGISDFLGTIAVSVWSPMTRANLTWLPRWLTSTNPAASSRRLTSRKGSGLSRPNLHLNRADAWRPSGVGRLEVKLERFPQVAESFLLGFALAGDVEFKALRDKPVSFPPNGRSER